MSSINLYLSTEELNFIDEFVNRIKNNNNNEDTEVELRIRLKNTPIFNLIDKIKEKYKIEGNIINDNSIIKDNYRKITTNNTDVYQRKTQLFSHIIDFINFDVKFTINKEENIDEKDINKQLFNSGTIKRNRNRTIFKFEYYDFVITKINNESIEYEIEFHNDKLSNLDIKNVVGPLKEFLILLFPLAFSFSADLINTNYKQYNSFIKKIRFMQNKPRALRRSYIQNFFNSNYSVTNKLDGIKYNLFIFDGILFLFNDNINQSIYLCDNDFDNTIFHNDKISLIEGEWFNNHFYIFDVIVFNDIDVRHYSHLNRINYIKNVGIPNVSIKNFLTSVSGIPLTQRIRNVLLSIKGKEQDNDGIIFTPENSQYYVYDKNDKTNKSIIYKFKFNHTIDFYVDKNYGLNVCDYNNGENYSYKNINKQILDLDKYKDSKSLIGKIVEMEYVNNIFFKILRIREDKNKPNALKIYNDTIDVIEKDKLFTINNLLGLIYREYQNIMKRKLLFDQYVLQQFDSMNIVDLGAGLGGDLHKYIEFTNLKKEKINLYNVEPNESNFKELNKRILLNKNIPKNLNIMKSINAYSQDTNKIITTIGKNNTNIVSMFFVLTFLFENDSLLQNCINTIDSLLCPNGLFIGTVMDGTNIKNFLKNHNNNYVNEYINIKLNSDDTIFISFKSGASLKESGQLEYLTDMSKLESYLKNKNFMKIKLNPFPRNNLIFTNEENDLIQCNSSFIFEKWMSIPVTNISTKITDYHFFPIRKHCIYNINNLRNLLAHSSLDKYEISGYLQPDFNNSEHNKFIIYNKHIYEDTRDKNVIPFTDIPKNINYKILWHNHPFNTNIHNGFLSLEDLIDCIKNPSKIHILVLCETLYIYKYTHNNTTDLDIKSISKWYNSLQNIDIINKYLINKDTSNMDNHMKWAYYMELLFSIEHSIFNTLKGFGIYFARVSDTNELNVLLHKLI